ncbi:hypothetical protein B0T17DRAFT_506775 [Bombardia bombarda]|uniref:Uncharacterized protein n=1 Tax=Bombardia bombarda TaxID=252184 RepID=A0AA40CAA6_9PEZI|nr:hypothetical protein B0T17DRAFT_506775 [Bombardia bombarda]
MFSIQLPGYRRNRAAIFFPTPRSQVNVNVNHTTPARTLPCSDETSISDESIQSVCKTFNHDRGRAPHPESACLLRDSTASTCLPTAPLWALFAPPRRLDWPEVRKNQTTMLARFPCQVQTPDSCLAAAMSIGRSAVPFNNTRFGPLYRGQTAHENPGIEEPAGPWRPHLEDSTSDVRL